MTTRDRLVLVAISALAVLGAVWLLLVSPERSKANKLSTEVTAATTQLASVEAQASDARAAQQRYTAAYSAVLSLGKAVPASEEVPSLIYQLAQASNQKHVEFSSISTGGGTGSASPSSPAPAAVAAAGFTQMPFTFVFAGDFSNLYHLFQQLNQATVRTASGGLQVSGRLLTLQAVKLDPSTAEVSGSQKLTGTITATAYVLPATQGLTGGATAASPVATTPAPSAGSSSSTASASPSSSSSPSSGSSSSSAGSSSAPAAMIGAVR
ncbi:MAG TPA: type II secretion system protein GspM [Solirubrobacteraceae bacterium]|nr:type II secretion system protein GspM [Solirubrobacteraceae bacterium]